MMMNPRRDSDDIRRTASIQLVGEVRGVWYRILSGCIGSLYMLSGIRDILFCDTPITGSDFERQYLLSMWDGCHDDKHKALVSGLVGVFGLTHAAIRFRMVGTSHVADLYNMMFLVLFIDTLMMFLLYRHGIESTPIYYLVLLPMSWIHEVQVYFVAYRAYEVRQKYNGPKPNPKND